MNKLSGRHYIACLLVGCIYFVPMFVAVKCIAPYVENRQLFYLCNNGITVLDIVIPICLVRFFLHEPVSDYGIHLKKGYLQIIYAILLACVLGLGGVSFDIPLRRLKGIVSTILEKPLICFYELVVTALATTSEEMIFRGFFITFFRKCFNNNFISIALSAIIFGMVHFPFNHNWTQVWAATSIGIVYGYLRVKEPDKFSVFSLSIAHTLHNLLFFW